MKIDAIDAEKREESKNNTKKHKKTQKTQTNTKKHKQKNKKQINTIKIKQRITLKNNNKNQKI